MRHANKILAGLAVVIAALGIYAGAYAALVEFDSVKDFRRRNGRVIAPAYRIGGDLSRCLFTPAYEVDLLLRPNHWKSKGSWVDGPA